MATFSKQFNLFLTYPPLQESLESNLDGHPLSLHAQEVQEASTLQKKNDTERVKSISE